MTDRSGGVEEPAVSRRGEAGLATAGPGGGGSVAAVRARLHADCGRCAGLCCVAPGFAASADFPISKPPGVACRHLTGSFTCAVHDELRPRGFHGCAVFDCLGAGQQVSQVTFAGRDWRAHPGQAGRMFDVFTVMRTLHESLHHLGEALSLLETAPTDTEAPETAAGRGAVSAALRAVWAETLTLTETDADTLLAVDLPTHRRAVHETLTHASALLRAHPPSPADTRHNNAPEIRASPGTDSPVGQRDRWAGTRAGRDRRGEGSARQDRRRDSPAGRGGHGRRARGDTTTMPPAALARPAHWKAEQEPR
jgi:hypothetical protein